MKLIAILSSLLTLTAPLTAAQTLYNVRMSSVSKCAKPQGNILVGEAVGPMCLLVHFYTPNGSGTWGYLSIGYENDPQRRLHMRPSGDLVTVPEGQPGTMFQYIQKKSTGVSMFRSNGHCVIYRPNLNRFTGGRCDQTDERGDFNFVDLKCAAPNGQSCRPTQI